MIQRARAAAGPRVHKAAVHKTVTYVNVALPRVLVLGQSTEARNVPRQQTVYLKYQICAAAIFALRQKWGLYALPQQYEARRVGCAPHLCARNSVIQVSVFSTH